MTVRKAAPLFWLALAAATVTAPSAAPWKCPATANRVYPSKAYPGYRYEIDKDPPSASGRTGGGGSTATGPADGSAIDTWRKGPTFEIGQSVTYQSACNVIQHAAARAGAPQ